MNDPYVHNWLDNYEPPQKAFWTGRKSKIELGNQYWYQAIEMASLSCDSSFSHLCDVALVGYACDEGVRRNLGRVGTQLGPNAIRQQLARLPFHHESKRVLDFGNVNCQEYALEDCQVALEIIVHQLIKNRIFPIVIGGGHDVAFGHFNGIMKSIENTAKNKVGIINFDAHFDLRPVERQGNSGTPFSQILYKYKEAADYFIIGIQQQSNTKELFDIAKKKQVEYIYNYDCDLGNFEAITKQLIPFIERNDWIYISIDMDGFSSAYSPGVSAPSPLGFTPYFVFKTLKYLVDTQKVISLDIAEVNPHFDRDNITANLAARIIDFTLGIL